MGVLEGMVGEGRLRRERSKEELGILVEQVLEEEME